MKIVRVGRVIIEADIVKVEDFEIAADPEEIAEMVPGELNSRIAETATKWALGRLNAEVERATAETIKKMVKNQKAN